MENKFKSIRIICLFTFIQAFILSAYSQGITVTGTITDGSESLPGVSVLIKGSATGTTTDQNGRYSLTVPNQNTVLQFSYVGFTPQEISVGNRTVINITLQEDTQIMDEVVVVGYGTQKRGSIIGSVTSMNTEDIENIAVTTLSTALAGRLSGVSISTPSSRPGISSSFTVRAQGTPNNRAPLFVIDGVVSSQETFDALDTGEVENISVLKDGASAAIYGSRAANGVVLVSTKKGSTSKPVINYSGTFGFSDAVGVPEVMTAYEHATYMNDFRYLTWLTNPDRDLTEDPKANAGYFTDDELAHFKTTDYWILDDEWRTPISTNHRLSVTGGTDAVKYFISGSYIYDKGSFDNLDYSRYTFRASVDAKITKNLSAMLNINTNRRSDQRPNNNSGSDNMSDLYKMLLLRTRMVPAYINGLPVAHQSLGIEQHAGMNIKKEGGNMADKRNNMNITAEIRYDIPGIKGLQASASYNTFTRNRLLRQSQFPYTMYFFTPSGEHGHYIDVATAEVTGSVVRASSTPSFIRKTSYLTQQYQLNFFLKYNNTFDKHDVGGLLGYEQYESEYETFNAQRNDVISPSMPYFFAASQDVSDSVVGDGADTEDARLSYFGRLNYAYDSKYLLEAVFRVDGSVRFAPSERWGFFPSISAGWILSSEDFFRNNIKFINFFKLRSSVSRLGNDSVGGWQWMERYTISNSVNVFEDASYAILPGTLANPNLTWEKATTYNIGFDTRLLKNRLNLSFEYYTRRTSDILAARSASVPTTFGASLPDENYAVIKSKGYETEAAWNDKINRDLSYNLRGNFGFGKSWWVQRDEAANLRPYLSEIGQPIGRVWGYECTGIIRTEEEAQQLRDAGVTYLGSQPRAGMLKYKDIRGPIGDEPDGIITTDDQVVVVQNADPRYTFGFGGGLKWKTISFDIWFQGLGGYQKVNNYRTTSADNYTNQFAWKNDHWTPDNPNASQPSPVRSRNGEVSTFWKRDASFLRCKYATINFDVPKTWISSIGINRARFFVQGTDLFVLFNKIYWMDPEAEAATYYPRLREFTFGLNITL